MSDRDAELRDALAESGFGDWDRTPLAGDASRRRYERLSRAGDTRILMDAPLETAGDIRPFLRIAEHLSGIGLHPPRIDFADSARGVIVMEDFGDDLLARHSVQYPHQEAEFYVAAAEILAHLQACPPAPDLPRLDATEGVRLVVEVADWLPGSATSKDALLAELDAALRRYSGGGLVMALRDYHAENLVVCSNSAGLRRLGLLDFQDAVLADPTYDLVSLLRDVRRVVGREANDAAVARFAELTGTDHADLGPALAVQAVQRNLRILGVFTRLARRDGKSRYLDYVPRLSRLLTEDLAHPDLAALNETATKITKATAHET